MFKRSVLILTIILMAVPVCLADGNAVDNGEMISSDGITPDGWYCDDWYGDGSTAWYMEGPVGDTCAVIENLSENDARYAQTVCVAGDTVYRFSCMAMAEGCVGGRGANLSVENTYCYSASLYDTDGEWQELYFYGRTPEDAEELTVYARLGGYSGLTKGKACFRDVRIESVESVPEGETVYSLTLPGSSNAKTGELQTDEMPPRYTPQWLLLGIGFMLITLKCSKALRAKSCTKAAPFLVFALAFAVRFAIAYAVRGYHTDINCFMSWSERMGQTGPVGFYSEDMFCDYPPLYMLLLGLPSLIRRALGIAAYSAPHVVLVKAIPILCDGAGAYAVYRAGRRSLGKTGALLLSCLILFNPAVITDSAAWGQIDSVLVIALMLACLYLESGRPLIALPLFACALLLKPQALLYAPIGLLYLVLRCRRDRRLIVPSVIGVLLFCAVTYGVFALFIPQGESFSLLAPAQRAIDCYSSSVTGYDYLVLNTLNLYEALGLNWAATASRPYLTAFAWAMFAASYLYCALLLIRGHGKKGCLPLAAAVFTCLMWSFAPMMHERYVYPAVWLILLACTGRKDRRLLTGGIVISFLLFMNQVLVLQGGLTKANYGHLQQSENWLNVPLSILTILTSLFLAWTAWDILIGGRRYPLPEPKRVKPVNPFRGRRPGRAAAGEKWCVLLVTLLYSGFAFWNLGTLSSPENGWTSQSHGESAVFDLGEEKDFYAEYYGGICSATFTLEFSRDGETWSDAWYANYDQGEIFRWLRFVPLDNALDRVHQPDGLVHFSYGNNDTPLQTARYVRLTSAGQGLILYEVGFTDADGDLLPVTLVSGPAELIDEQDTVPAYPSYYNSTYFDEIYHARTAFEHLHGLQTYEWTHPPLGKVLMMVGISLFGMCPFGWRFMGCLAGCLMLPVMYALARQLTRSSRSAVLAMLLLALDSMHFTQTRIATIDSYAVLFIMLEYLCMLRFRAACRSGESLARQMTQLGLSGLMMGCACTVKWIGIYSAIGLAAIYFLTLYEQAREKGFRAYLPRALALCGACLLFFIVIPCVLYYFSYYWQYQYEGGLTIERVWNTQKNMLNYHAGLSGDTHYFRSDWYEWPVIYWPMWYYSGSDHLPADMVSSISCMGNPCVWWCGLAALLYWIWRAFSRSRTPEGVKMCLIGFASQYLPWVLVPRSTFIYHYFASVPFIILLLALYVDGLARRSPRLARTCGITLVSVSAILFFGFYPLESGWPAPRSYVKYLRWFRWYNY